MTTLVKNPTTGLFSGSGGGGMVSMSPSPTTPYGSPVTGYFANLNDYQSAFDKLHASDPAFQSSSSQPSIGSLAPKSFTPPQGQVSVPTSTGNKNLDKVLGVSPDAPQPPQGSNPYSLFNTYVASILSQIQTAASAGRANLGGAKDFLSTESVAPNGPTPFDPTIASGNQIQNQQTLQAGFTPAITSINTQLSNANADIAGLTGAIPGIEAATLPTSVAGGNSLMTPNGQNLGTAPVYNSAINPLTLKPYGWSQSPGTGGGTSGVATSTGTVDFSTYAQDPNYNTSMQRQYTATSTDLQTLNQQLGGDPATVMNQYIKNNAPKSQITGAMVTSIANQFGIDPAMLASQMLHETDFGTAGEAPANNNPGGVKYVGQVGATRGTPAPDGGDYAKFASWSQGIAAEAHEIATRQSPSENQSSSTVDIKSDAQALANGTVAPQVLQDRYTKAGVPALYLQAVQLAKQINPSFNETQANLNYQGAQTQTENKNSGNPITSIFSNLKDLVTSPSAALNILNPSKPKGGVTSSGMGYTILP